MFISVYTVRLPEETKQAPSVASFKHRLNRDLNKPPIYFNAGTRRGQILHTRLRLECSSLNAHLYRKNLVPEPTCQCGAILTYYCMISLVAGDDL